jgi:cysteine desulfurase
MTSSGLRTVRRVAFVAMAQPRLFLDHASGAPLRGEARASLAADAGRWHANPSAPHAEGRAAKDALEEARGRVAAALGCRPREVLFTAGGTEAANLAVHGAAAARASGGRHIVVTAVEHPCVLAPARALESRGWRLTVVPVDEAGRVDPGAVLAAATPDTALVAVMLANHETGNLLPVAQVAAGLEPLRIPLLVDAVLGAGRVDVSPTALGANLLVLSSPKVGGPQGVGALVVRRPTRLEPLLVGGLQEERLRPGTENVAAVRAFAAALEAAVAEHSAAAARLEAWIRAFLAGLSPLTGWRRLGDPARALPGLVTLELDGVEGEAAMINLDLQGIAVATGSTCALGGTEVSPSLLAMGLSARRAAATLRVSPGADESLDGAARAAAALASVVERLRALARR